jgi:hypothetical protein
MFSPRPLPANCEFLRSAVFHNDRWALSHALGCLREFDPALRADGLARVDALVATGATERSAVITVAGQMAAEIEAAAKARLPVRSTDMDYHWQRGDAARAHATAEANCLWWLEIVAGELRGAPAMAEAA